MTPNTLELKTKINNFGSCDSREGWMKTHFMEVVLLLVFGQGLRNGLNGESEGK
jgi:hypothetical protein